MEIKNIIEENTFENVVWEMLSISSRPEFVNINKWLSVWLCAPVVDMGGMV